jgi:hypothetical protein
LRFKLTGGSLDSATAIQDLLDHKDGQAASSCLSAGGISPSGCALRGMPASSAIAAPSPPTGSLRWRARPFGATGVAFFDQLQANDKWKSSNGDFLADAGLRPAIAHQEPNLGTAVPESARQLFATVPSDIWTISPDTVNSFIGSAPIVPQNKDGSFPETAANDEMAGSSNCLGSQPLSEGLPPDLNYAPESLRAPSRKPFQGFPRLPHLVTAGKRAFIHRESAARGAFRVRQPPRSRVLDARP